MTTTTILSDNGVSSGSAGIKTTGGNDGTLALQTTTSGGTATTAVSIDTSQNTTVAGNLTFSGSAKRITGDFTNATQASKVMFQSSTTNGNTNVGFLPNGTAVQTVLQLHNNADPTNAGICQLITNTTDISLRSGITGTGTYLPMTFYTGGSERMRLTTDGNMNFGSATTTAAGAIRYFDIANTENTNGASGVDLRLITYNAAGSSTTSFDISKSRAGGVFIVNYEPTTAGSIVFQAVGNIVTNPTSGNTLHLSAGGGLGYGTGSGGTVTQATNKGTAVTLNKPTGQITMNNAALAAGASAYFVVNNSLVGSTDVVYAVLTGGAISGASNYEVKIYYASAGSFGIKVTNVGGASLSEALQIQFAIIKGATS